MKDEAAVGAGHDALRTGSASAGERGRLRQRGLHRLLPLRRSGDRQLVSGLAPRCPPPRSASRRPRRSAGRSCHPPPDPGSARSIWEARPAGRRVDGRLAPRLAARLGPAGSARTTPQWRPHPARLRDSRPSSELYSRFRPMRSGGGSRLAVAEGTVSRRVASMAIRMTSTNASATNNSARHLIEEVEARGDDQSQRRHASNQRHRRHPQFDAAFTAGLHEPAAHHAGHPPEFGPFVARQLDAAFGTLPTVA